MEVPRGGVRLARFDQRARQDTLVLRVQVRRLLRERRHDAIERLHRFADAPGEGYGSPTVADGDPAANVCSCLGVTRGEILHAIRDRSLRTVAQVAEHTRASTGCGGCRPDVVALLAAAGA